MTDVLISRTTFVCCGCECVVAIIPTCTAFVPGSDCKATTVFFLSCDNMTNHKEAVYAQ